MTRMVRAFLSLRMFVLSIVISRKETSISRVFLRRFFWVEDKKTLTESSATGDYFERSRLFNCPTNWLREIINLPNASVTLRQDNVTSEGKSIVIVVSPLSALIDDQINKLVSVGVA